LQAIRQKPCRATKRAKTQKLFCIGLESFKIAH